MIIIFITIHFFVCRKPFLDFFLSTEIISMFAPYKNNKLEFHLSGGPLFDWSKYNNNKSRNCNNSNNVLPMRNGEIFGSGEQIESHWGNFSSMTIAILDWQSTGNLAINFYLRSFSSVILYYLISFINKNKCFYFFAKTSANLCLKNYSILKNLKLL
jgi:hypothetical protein